jgi:flagellar export protein FliJ
MSSAHLKDYHDFLHRLDTAVKAQQQLVRDSEKNLEAHRKRWIAKRQRLESLQRVLDRYQEEDQLHDARMEQKRLDDLPNSQVTAFGADDD